MTKQESTVQRYRRKVSEQRKWVDRCGGSEAAYIDRYGSPGDPHCYSDGGSAIWKADKANLDHLESELSYWEARAR